MSTGAEGTRPVVLSERESEFQLFDQVVDGALSGHGEVIFISAAVGIGKTALLRALDAHATARGVLCCTVTASADERSYAFGLMDRLAAALHAAGVSGFAPPVWRSDCRTEPDLFAVLERLVTAIRDFVAVRPLALAIDDVHFADDDSVRCLAYLIRRAGPAGLMIVVTENAARDRELAALHAEVLNVPFCRWVRLAPFTRRGITEQLGDRLGVAPSCELVAFCATMTGGNALLLTSLIDDLPAAGVEPGQPGAAYRRAILRILHRSEPGTAAVARAAAVLGASGSATPQLIAELLGVSHPQVWEDLCALRAAGLFADPWPSDAAGPVVFRHEQARFAVLSSIPPADLPEMHSRVAELMYSKGAPASEVAEQLVAAHDGDKAQWWVAELCEAAGEAMAAGNVAGAVTWLRHAACLVADEAERARVAVLLADAEWHADPATSFRRLPGLSQDARAGLLTGRDRLVLVGQLLWWGEFADADALLRAVGEPESEQPSVARRPPTSLSLAGLWEIFCGSGVAPEDATWSGPIAAVTYLGSAAALAAESAEVRGVDQVLRGIRAGISLTPALFAIVQLVRTGRLDEAVRWSDRLLGEDWIRRVPMRRATIEMIKVMAALRGGEPAEALRLARAVFVAVPPAAWGVTVGLPLSLAVHAATELGDFSTARSYLDLPVPPAMFDSPFAVSYLQALGQYHLAMGYPEAALTCFRSCAELLALSRRDAAEETDPPSIARSRNGAAIALGAIGMIRPMGGLGDRRRIQRTPRSPAVSTAPSDVADPHPELDESLAAQLTHAERRVAALASTGKTNRQIAEDLFITVSTVEQHLTKIYRKLAVQSRSALAIALRRHHN